MSIDYGKYFKEEEFKCKHSGLVNMNQEFVNKLNLLREKLGKPILLSSAYRDVTHPIEARKIAKGGNGGQHSKGLAVDILCNGKEAHELLNVIIQMDCFTGIGFSQKSSLLSRFIHIDMAQDKNTRPTIWSY